MRRQNGSDNNDDNNDDDNAEKGFIIISCETKRKDNPLESGVREDAFNFAYVGAQSVQKDK